MLFITYQNGHIVNTVDDGLPDLSDGVTLTSTCTLNDNDQSHLCDASSGPISVTPGAGKQTFVKYDSTANKVTIVGTINGVVNPTLDSQYQTITTRKIGGVLIVTENN